MKYTYLSVFVAIFLLLSCKSNNEQISLEELQSTKWKVAKIANDMDFSYTDAPNAYFLEFKTDYEFQLSLDVNECMGGYSFNNNGGMTFQMGGCTKICCDSFFAENLLILLAKMSTWSLSNNQLILEGEGEIVLDKY